MNNEEELKLVKQQQLKRARVTAVVLGLSSVIVVLFMMYGFTQSIEAQRQRDLAMVKEILVSNAKAEIIKVKEELMNLKEQLAKCESSKK